MRHSLQLVAAAVVLALMCGCQTMPTMQPGPPASVMTNPNPAPAPIMESDGGSAVVDGAPGVVSTDGGYYGSDCGCDDGACYGGGYGTGGCGPGGGQLGSRIGLQARNMHHNFRGPHGPPVTQITYPYYTLRGPRDFLADDPPSLGP